MDAVEAEAIVLVITTMRGVMVLAEEEITATMIEVEGHEAEVLFAGVEEAEVLGEGETGVQSGKVVPREGQKLSNGTRKEKRENLLEIITVKVMNIAMVSNIMVASPMTRIYIHQIKEMEAMTSKGRASSMVRLLSNSVIPLSRCSGLFVSLFPH